MGKCNSVVIPLVLFVANLIVAVATGVIVIYKDRISEGLPNDIPKFNAIAGIPAVYLTLSLFFRMLCCRKSGTWCGISMFSFLLMASLHALLLAKIVDLSRDERKFYKEDVKDIYDLSIVQMSNFGLYMLLLIIQISVKCNKNKVTPTGEDDIFV